MCIHSSSEMNALPRSFPCEQKTIRTKTTESRNKEKPKRKIQKSIEQKGKMRNEEEEKDPQNNAPPNGLTPPPFFIH
ncbi:hypothetical protein BYT27DRAFT_7198447 [Phlegmacium glaucopus]|nr:hypothetical protein BYT27DRAFT_7198447 [Phlegmacium glaucopus]